MARCILLVLSLFFPTLLIAQTCQQPADSHDQAMAGLVNSDRQAAAYHGKQLGLTLQQVSFTRETAIRNSKGKVIARCLAEIVFDDHGDPVVAVKEQSGKLKYRRQLKHGEAWIQHSYDFKKFFSTVEVKEVGEAPEFSSYVSKGAPEITLPSWARGATIKVTIEGFTAEEQIAIRRGVEAWNIGIVKFTFEGEGLPLIIKRGDVGKILGLTDRTPLAYFNPWVDGTTVLSAEIVLDHRLTNLEAIQSAVAHEMGHGLSLSDCKQCKSVMKAEVGVNKSSGYLGPSPVDLKAIKRGQ